MWTNTASISRSSKVEDAADLELAAEQLLVAAQRGDTAEARELLRAGADPNLASGGSLPLQQAAARGYFKVAYLLLKHGAAVDAVDAKGHAALHYAAAGYRTWHAKVAWLLLDRGADVNAAVPSGHTALHFAAESGHIDVARLLLDRGADAGATTAAEQDSVGFGSAQPLHLAAYHKRLALVELLLASGADVRARASWKDVTAVTPLHCAVLKHHLAHSPTHEAAAVVGALLDAGAAVDAAAFADWQPLHLAVGYGVTDTIAALVARGADVHAATAHGYAPLHLACSRVVDSSPRRALACVQQLLDVGADVNAPMDGESGSTPLHLAAFEARDADGVAVLAELLRRGADARAVDNEGSTPLHDACARLGPPVPEAAQLLLEHGADARAADAIGWTPLHWLAAPKRKQDDESRHGAADERADEGSDDPEAVEMLIEALVERGADVDAVDDAGRTLLMLAADRCNGAISAALLRCGARIGPPECGRCAAADEVRAGVQCAVVGMAAEAARLQRQQLAWQQERAVWAKERAALARQQAALKKQRAALAQERAALERERAAVEAARGGSGGGGGSGQQGQREQQPVAARLRSSRARRR